MAAEPRVTLIVTPRERWGVAQESLESIYAHTDQPFDLVYVDAGSPGWLGSWIATQAQRRRFRHIATPGYLSPNQARNIGIRAARTEYVVFIDNDVICSPGWLPRLVATADETRADVVAPLTCQSLPLHSQIHQAGADFTHDVAGFFATPPGQRRMTEQMHLQGQPVSAAPSGPVETQACEFHCSLARRSIFDRIGLLDEEMLATKEHLDFCMSVIQAGGRVILEPRSRVTYLFPNRARPMTIEDWPYFLIRWSEEWQRRSLVRLAEKWGLDPDQPYLRERHGNLRWRYSQGLVRPLLKRVPFADRNEAWRRFASRAISRSVTTGGRFLTRRHSPAAPGGGV